VIAFVAGRVAALAPDGAVVEVGGVGLSVSCTPTTIAGLRIGESAHLPTSLVVREDSLTLYGFADEDERVVFELLHPGYFGALKTNPIGPWLVATGLVLEAIGFFMVWRIAQIKV